MAKKRPSYILYSKDSAIPHAERWLQLSARETKHTDKKTSQYRGVSIYRIKGTELIEGWYFYSDDNDSIVGGPFESEEAAIKAAFDGHGW
jgi:hypothetical protein